MGVFTRAYQPGNDQLLFLDGHCIPSLASFKFLVVWFDAKLLSKTHINLVANRCNKLKNEQSSPTKIWSEA